MPDDNPAPSDQATSDQSETPSKDAAQNEQNDKDKDKDKDSGGTLRKHPILLIIGAVVAVGLIIGGILYWLHARNFESTDDAFVDAHLVQLAPQINGRVTSVTVTDNQLVHAGQMLVTIDSADAQTKVAQTQGQYAQAVGQLKNARAQIHVDQDTYKQALADVAAAQASADNAARDLARYHALVKLNVSAVAQQQYDKARADAQSTAAQRNSALRAAQAKLDQVRASLTQVSAQKGVVDAAKSQIAQANITENYARIAAPVDGHVAQLSVAVGNYVQPGSQMLAIVPLGIYVTANFKETQLALMRPGQPATIVVDSCPGQTLHGHVDSIQRGAGQAFAILPPENATGNYVKVVQRVPVKIAFDALPKECVLGPGMSVEPTVRVR
ncbi:HlyD family secretion protein [Novosphingobium sp.]|uniref:HlyD family secretion protein n=1 Tax=Novosphingobium sp. TaxID=1874826 RepID=UPI003D0AFD98